MLRQYLGEAILHISQVVIRSCISKDRQSNGQKDKQRSTKHYTEN